MLFPLLGENLPSLVEAIVESSEDAIFSKTVEGQVVSWNRGAQQLYGYRAHEMIGRSVAVLVPEERQPELAAILQRLAQGERIAPFETVRRRKDGRLVEVSLTISPLHDATGKLIGASTIARDITERKQLHKQLQVSEQRFRALIEQSFDAIVLLDAQGSLLYTSPSVTRVLGYTPEELVGCQAFDLIHPEDVPVVRAVLVALLQEPGTCPLTQFRARRKNGSWCWLEGIGNNLLADASIGAIVGNYREITARKQAEERQRVLQDVSTVLVSSLDHQISLQEIAQLLVPALADYCRIALVDEQEQITDIVAHHMDPDQLALVEALYAHYKDQTHVPFGVQHLLQTGQPELIAQVSSSQEARQAPRELAAILKGLGLVSYMGVPLQVRGKTIGAITCSSVEPQRCYRPEDVSFAQELAWRIAMVLENARLHRQAQAELAERKRAEERQHALQQRLLALATTDPVTALPNHRALISRLEQELERAQRYGRPCCVLFVDLDHFKALNDGYGHASGDAVLAEFAALVHSQLRGMDTLGRWGGEEFVVILPEVQVEEALQVAEAVRSAVATHTFQVGGGIHLTCSIGLACSSLHAQGREDVVRAADQAMYAAKHFGRNQVHAAYEPAVRALFAASSATGGREEVALVGAAEALVALVQARDQLTGSHCQQVADLVHQLALALGWSAADAQMLMLAGRLHDLGKVAVPDSILRKAGRLTTEERALMQQHAAVGAEIVSHIPALRPLVPVIRAHHERWDGQGYPDQLCGEVIPAGARILTVVDAYLAMCTDRPYQQARAPTDALRELQRCAGSQFDPQVVDVLLRLLGQPGEEEQ